MGNILILSKTTQMKYIIIVASVFLLASCQKKEEKTETVNTDTVINDTVVTKSDSDGEYCFRKVIKQDSVILNFTRKGDKVEGIFHWKPYEKDKKIASFTGTMDGHTANTIGEYDAEGTHFKEELVFMLDDDNHALIRFGEMHEGKDGIWRYRNKENAGVQVLPKVQCD